MMIRGNIHNGSNNQSVQKKYNICRAIYLQKYYNKSSEHEAKSIVGEAKPSFMQFLNKLFKTQIARLQ